MPAAANLPGSLLELSGSYWKACALHAGAMLDVFTPLADEALAAETLAERLGCDARALAMLLHALCAMELLVKAGDSYRLAEAVGPFLDTRSPAYVGYAIRHHHRLMASWARLPEAVQTGEPMRWRTHMGNDPGDREDFLMAMFNLALAIAPRLAASLDLSGRSRLIDLGGGPGTYAVHFCLANPGLRATVFDLPTSEPFAASVRQRFGVADRVDFVAGNYLTDPVPGGFDVAWLSQVLHAEDPQGALTLLRQAAGALVPGGLLYVHEFFLDDSLDGPEFATLFSLNMLLGTPRGQAYSLGQVREMLGEVGVVDVRLLDFCGPNQSRLVCGTKA